MNYIQHQFKKLKKYNSNTVAIIKSDSGIYFWLNFISCLILKLPVIPMKWDLSIEQKKKIFSQFNNLIEIGKNKVKVIQKKKLKINQEDNEISVFALTGGSTGDNKVVALPLRVLLKNALFVKDIVKFKKKDILFINIPLNFISSISHFFSVLFSGCSFLSIQNNFFLNDLEEIIFKNKISYFGGAPMQVEMINSMSNNKINSLKKVITSGDFLYEKTSSSFLKKFNNKKELIQFYGLTEVGGRFCHNIVKKKNDTKSGVVGVPLKYLKYKNLKNSSQENPKEIIINSSEIFNGYLNSKPKYEFGKSLKYFKTGDLGYIFKKKLCLVSRSDDVFKSAGTKILPSVVRNEILKFKNIIDCYVTKKFNENYGFYPVALIQSKGKLDQFQLKKFLEKTITKNMCPREFIKLNKIPRVGTNKIDKKKVLEIING